MKLNSLLFLFILYGCSALEGEQKTNVNHIIKSQEIKRISQTDILIHAEKMGGQMIEKLNNLSYNVFCLTLRNSENFFVDSLKTNLGIQISAGSKSTHFESEIEKMLFEAYLYNQNNDVPSVQSVQKFDDSTILFTYPILLDTAKIKSCELDTSSEIGMWSIMIPMKTIVNDI